MRMTPSVALILLAVGCAGSANMQASQSAAPVTVEQIDSAIAGSLLAHEKCSACHAVERGRESPVSTAPAFASIGEKYADASLVLILSEGIATGHPSMPRWMFTVREAKDLLAYIRTLRNGQGG